MIFCSLMCKLNWLYRWGLTPPYRALRLPVRAGLSVLLSSASSSSLSPEIVFKITSWSYEEYLYYLCQILWNNRNKHCVKVCCCMFSIMWGFGCYRGIHSNSWLIIVWVTLYTYLWMFLFNLPHCLNPLKLFRFFFSAFLHGGRSSPHFLNERPGGNKMHTKTLTLGCCIVFLVTGKPGEIDGCGYYYCCFPLHKIYFLFRLETLMAFPFPTHMESQHSFFRVSLL